MTCKPQKWNGKEVTQNSLIDIEVLMDQFKFKYLYNNMTNWARFDKICLLTHFKPLLKRFTQKLQ